MISNAYAQAAGNAPAGDPFPSLLIIIGMFVLMYFFMIRPQQKKAKEHKQMVDALQKGDEVIALGIIGRITKVGDGYIGLEVSDGTVLHVQKQAVSTLLPKGTFNDVLK
ncbi:MAG TPA: preprotein translocase subunit YajC [Usitatibacteraceae bacterium]|nr:preprotein translocase subunit YajC [Usitatibacteraceae bacterium]